ncbi:MAG: hypothetical protein ACOZAM_11825 [Pseudomonadota bacterium]
MGLFLALPACAMPALEDSPRNLLTAPPDFADRADMSVSQEPAMAVQASAELSQATRDDVLLAGSGQPALDERPQPEIPADGMMHGEFAGSSLAFADADGLVCAGRLIGRTDRLARGMSVPINCSDGSTGRVKITDFTAAGEVRGQLSLANDRQAPVVLAKSAEGE